MSGESMGLVWPNGRYLAGYVHALQQGWSPDNLRSQAASDELARIAEDPRTIRVLSKSTGRPRDPQSLFRTVRPFQGYRATRCGCGMGSLWLDRLSLAARNDGIAPRTAWATSGIRWFLGNEVAATRQVRSSCCFHRHKQKGLPISS